MCRDIDNVALHVRWPLTTGVAQGRYYCSHYSQLFNCVTCDRHKNYTLDAVKLISNDYDTFNPGDINHSIAPLCSNKACGIDVLFAEHLLHASPEIHVLLSICFNAFIVPGFLPNPLTDTVLVPIVKDKTKNISDKATIDLLSWLQSCLKHLKCLFALNLNRFCIRPIISLVLKPITLQNCVFIL